jgi:hypothetical protein
MPSVSTILQIASPILMVLALLRYASTSANSPEKEERGSTALLLALITGGAFGAAGRDRYRAGSTPFWLATAGLAIVCALTILVLIKLFRAYRLGETDATPRKSNTFVIRPPDTKEDDDGPGGAR